MTITVPLTPEEEAKLIVIAEARGVSADASIKGVVKDIIKRGLLASKGEAGELGSEDREKLEELFQAFDSASPAPGVPEEAFHRENWYR